MKAIVAHANERHAPDMFRVYGYGVNEERARIEAFAFLNNGHNRFEQEHKGDILVDVSAEMEAIYNSDDHNTAIRSCYGVVHNNTLFPYPR